MENTTTIYTDVQGRVFMHQNEDSTLTAHEVSELPPIPEEPLKDGYYIYIDGVFTFGYELNENKCYGTINDLRAYIGKYDYVFRKKAEGCDVSKYGNFEDECEAWRVEINRIQELLT